MGDNVSISCPEVPSYKDTYQVHDLKWLRRRSQEAARGGSSSSTEKLISFDASGAAVHKSQGRISLDESGFAIRITRAREDDSGEIYCLVNGKTEPSAITRLIVHGN